MKKPIYEIKDIRSLCDIRFEKARILIEMSYLREQMNQQKNSYLSAGFLGSMKIGMDIAEHIFGQNDLSGFIERINHWITGLLDRRDRKSNDEK